MAKNLKLDYKSIMKDGRGDKIIKFLELFIGAIDVEIVEEEGGIGYHYRYDPKYEDRIPFIQDGTMAIILFGHNVDYALKYALKEMKQKNVKINTY